MIDNLALAISHGLLLLATWRVLRRVDLDHETGEEPKGYAKRQPPRDA